MTKHILEKNLLIEELNHCLEDALSKRNDMECMLRSLRGAALVMTEAHQQDCSEKDKEINLLTSQFTAQHPPLWKSSMERIILGEHQVVQQLLLLL